MSDHSTKSVLLPQLESLESRCVLSSVLQLESIPADLNNGRWLGTPVEVNDEGLVLVDARNLYGEAFPSAVAVWNPKATAGEAVSEISLGNGEYKLGSIGAAGRMALRGVFDSHNESVGLFNAGQDKPYALIVGDTDAPTAAVASGGFGVFGDQGTLRWTIAFQDSTFVKRSAINGDEFELTLPDKSKRPVSLVRVLGNGDGSGITAVYEAHVPTISNPEIQPVPGRYALTLRPGSVSDTLGHQDSQAQIWSLDVHSKVAAWTDPKEPDPGNGPVILPFDGHLEWSLSNASINSSGHVALNAFAAGSWTTAAKLLVTYDGSSLRSRALDSGESIRSIRILEDGRVAAVIGDSTHEDQVRIYDSSLESFESVVPAQFHAVEIDSISDDGRIVIFRGVISESDASTLGTSAGAYFYAGIKFGDTRVVRALANSSLLWQELHGVTNLAPNGDFQLVGLGGSWTTGAEVAYAHYEAGSGILTVKAPERILGKGDQIPGLDELITEVKMGNDAISNRGHIAFTVQSNTERLLVEATVMVPASSADDFIQAYTAAPKGADGLVDGDWIVDLLKSAVSNVATSDTYWGAQNYWFQSSNGDVWSLWQGGDDHKSKTLPDQHEWVLTNLTDAAGLSGSMHFAPGSLSGITTGWNALSIQGIQDGELMALWWSPESSAETYYVPKLDANGNPVLDDRGNPTYATRQGHGDGLRGNGWSLSSISDALVKINGAISTPPALFRAYSVSQGNSRTDFDPRATWFTANNGMSVILVDTSNHVYLASFNVWQQVFVDGARNDLNGQWLIERLDEVPSFERFGFDMFQVFAFEQQCINAANGVK